jgi:hypothetical protein
MVTVPGSGVGGAETVRGAMTVVSGVFTPADLDRAMPPTTNLSGPAASASRDRKLTLRLAAGIFVALVGAVVAILLFADGGRRSRMTR